LQKEDKQFIFTGTTLFCLEDGDRMSFETIRKVIFSLEDGYMGV